MEVWEVHHWNGYGWQLFSDNCHSQSEAEELRDSWNSLLKEPLYNWLIREKVTPLHRNH
jgi:hypothetical protein